MIIEYIRYSIPEARASGFEEAYGAAAAILADDPHCLAWLMLVS